MQTDFGAAYRGRQQVTNPFTYRRILHRNIRHIGIVPNDYPSEKLVNAIIDINHRLLKDTESRGKYHGYIASIQCQADVWRVVD